MSDSVLCPYCKQMHGCLFEYEMDDGDTIDVECDCGQTFRLQCSISVQYEAEKKDAYGVIMFDRSKSYMLLKNGNIKSCRILDETTKELEERFEQCIVDNLKEERTSILLQIIDAMEYIYLWTFNDFPRLSKEEAKAHVLKYKDKEF